MPKTVYFDWSIRNGVAVLVGENSMQVVFYPSLWAVLDLLQAGDTMIGEATFLSFDLDQREDFINHAAFMGIHLLTTPNRLTGKVRRREFPGQDKNDALDAVVIRIIAQDPSKLKPPAMPDPEWVHRREQANRELMMLRRTGTLTPKPRTPGRFNFTSQKDIQAAEWAAQLPPYSTLTDTQKLALGNGRDYNYVVVAAVGVATKHARNREEFDRLAGLYAHAYPTQIRADLHHYAWSGGNQRAKLVRELRGSGELVTLSPSKRLDGLTWSQYRRELRWLYHQMVKVV